MTVLVYINGLKQIDGIDYKVTTNSIAFTTPPQYGSIIEIRSRSGILAKVFGDGITYFFQFFSDFEHTQSAMLDEAFKLRHVPAVADMLERLQVVVELAKQND